MPIGERTEKLRLERGWTKTQLAERAGVSMQTVWNMEKHGSVSLDTVRKIARALGVTMDALAG